MADVFISYSRKDTDFVRELFNALKSHNREAWVDWQGIDYSTKWWEEICAGIEAADNFVLIISPDALNSVYCHREIERARKHHKRIIPFVYRPIDEAALIGGWYTHPEMRAYETLGRENWETIKTIQLIDLAKLVEFDTALNALLHAVDTDPEHVKLHTRLILRIRDWEGRGRSPSTLLRGDDLTNAESWLAEWDAEAKKKAPEPTDAQREYVVASRHAEDEERRKTEAQIRLTRRLRLAAIMAGLIGILALGSAGIAIWQGGEARNQAVTAVAAQEQAEIRESTADAGADAANIQVTLARNQAATANVAQEQAEIRESTADAGADAANVQVTLAHNQAATANAAQEAAEIRESTADAGADIANTQVAVAVATLIPIPPTLTQAANGLLAANTAVGSAQTAVHDAHATLTQIPPTLTSVAEEVELQRANANALQIIPYADRIYEEDNILGLSLAVAANQLSLSPPGDVQTILMNLANRPGPRLRFEGHADAATTTEIDAAISPDGRYIVSGSLNEFLIWDANSGERIHSLNEVLIFSLAYSPDSRYIAAGSFGYVALWDATSGQRLRILRTSTDPDSLDQVTSLAFSPDAKQLLSGTYGGKLLLWDYEIGEIIREFRGDSEVINAVAFSPDGRHIVSSADTDILLWDVESGAMLRRYTGHSGFVNAVAFSPDGQQMASGSGDHTVILWDIESGALIRRFAGHSGNVNSVGFVGNGRQLVTGSSDNTIALWDLETATVVRRFLGHSAAVKRVSISADGQNILSASEDSTLILWELNGSEIIRHFQGHEDWVWGVAYSPDGQQIISNSSGEILLWDQGSGEIIRRFEGYTGNVHSIRFSPDGQYILSISKDYTIVLWDVLSGKLIRRFEGQKDFIYGATFSRDGQQVISVACGNRDESDNACISALFIFWDVATGQIIYRKEKNITESLSNGTFSPDMQYLLSGSCGEFNSTDICTSGILVLWDLETGDIVREFEGHRATVTTISFSSDGNRIVSGSEDNSIIMWNSETGAIIRKYEGHSDTVTTVSFSPDGSRVASRSADNSIIVWDSETGAIIRRLDNQTDSVRHLAFSPNGQELAFGSCAARNSTNNICVSGEVVVWRLDSIEQLLAWTLENRVIRPLSCQERGTYNVEPPCLGDSVPATATLPATSTSIPSAVIPVNTVIASPTITNTPTTTPTVPPTSTSIHVQTASIGENVGEVKEGERQTWLYEGLELELLTIEVNSIVSADQDANNPLDIVLSIRNPQGVEIYVHVGSDLGVTSQLFMQNMLLFVAGVYEIEVGSRDNIGSGAYTLTIWSDRDSSTP